MRTPAPLAGFDAPPEWIAQLPWRLRDRAHRIARLTDFTYAVRTGQPPDLDTLRLIADALDAWMTKGGPLDHALGFLTRRGGKDETAQALRRQAERAGAVVVLDGNSDIRRAPEVAAISGAWRCP